MQKSRLEGFLFHPKADVDIEEIFIYSLETWGENQADKYITQIYSELARSRTLSGLWRTWQDEDLEVNYQRIGRHYVLFEASNDLIFVLGFIGDRMDFNERIRELFESRKS